MLDWKCSDKYKFICENPDVQMIETGNKTLTFERSTLLLPSLQVVFHSRPQILSAPSTTEEDSDESGSGSGTEDDSDESGSGSGRKKRSHTSAWRYVQNLVRDGIEKPSQGALVYIYPLLKINI